MSEAFDSAIDALHEALLHYVEAPQTPPFLPIYRAAQQVVRVALHERGLKELARRQQLYPNVYERYINASKDQHE